MGIKLGNIDAKYIKVGSDDCKVYLGDTLLYPQSQPHDYSQDYLTFVALNNGTFSFSGTSTANCLSYSTDSGTTWSEPARYITTPTITNGNTVMWKGNLRPVRSNGSGTFSATNNFNAEGNVMSCLFGDEFSGQTDLTEYSYAFNKLFSGNTKIISAENLIIPATTLSTYCYQSMFRGCKGLVTPPKLPATTVINRCYDTMFYGCTSLTTAPELPATTLATRCYNGMFSDCTKLEYIKCLATDISANYCLTNWVIGVAASGTFVKAASMTSWPAGVSGIPNNWIVQDYTG